MDLFALPAVQPGASRPRTAARWGLEELGGRLAELSSSTGGALSIAIELVLEAQLAGEPSAWVSAGQDLFYPPDVAECGVDLDALPVVRVRGAQEGARAAEHLARSGAFGLIVLDLGKAEPLPLAVQARLVKLAQRHETALLCLTRKDQESRSLGPLVSLRAEVRRERRDEGGFICELRILKDKRRGPGWTLQELRRGPPGLG